MENCAQRISKSCWSVFRHRRSVPTIKEQPFGVEDEETGEDWGGFDELPAPKKCSKVPSFTWLG